MPTVTETLSETNAKLEAMLAASAPSVTEEEKTLPAEEALQFISAELAKATTTPERKLYLKSLLAELAKNNWESTQPIAIKVVNDPMQQTPKTEPAPTLQGNSTAEPDSNFCSNMSALQKAQTIQKFLLDQPALKLEVKKSALTDKLDQIKKMFGLTDADLKDSYDLSWKVGDLIRLLQNAVKLEELVGDDVTKAEPAKTEKPAEPAALWPRDMAGAKFDPVKKAYDPEPNPWA